MIKLRPYQENAINDILEEVYFNNTRNIVLDAPTGSGKSVVISELCKRLDGNVVVMVNITPLVEQIANHLKECDIDFSIIKAGMEEHYNENHKVQLIMSQTYYARADKINIDCDYLIIDERHREYNTDRTNLVMSKLKPKSIIGLTATPFDQGGYMLSDSTLVSSVSVKKLTEDKFLSPVKYFVPKWSTELGLEDIRLSGADYSGSAIDEKFNNEQYVNQVISSMNAMNGRDKKTLVFCNSIDQCELVTEFLKKDGYDADCIHSKKSSKENEIILNSFKSPSGDLKLIEDNYKVSCLISVSKLNIGFDVRDIQLGVMLRPTKVRSLYIQTVGRLTRTADGKDYAEFLDLSGVVAEHGFHTEPYSPPEYGNKEDLLAVKTKAEAKEIKHIVDEEPTEITREDVEVFVRELKEKEKKIHEMEIKDLSALFDMSYDIDVIVEIAYRIQQVKSGEAYKASTIDWVAAKWESVLVDNEQYRQKWVKALKTRAKNIVRDNKKLASLYYFVDFLNEKKEDSYY
jgi:superfamily II DNA or RNA helicase